MKKLLLLCVMLLGFGEMVSGQSFYTEIRSKKSISIGKGSAVKANDSLFLEVGLPTDTLKQGVRLDSPRSDTARAYKLKGAIKYNRGDNAYYYYNGTLWVKM